MNRDYDEIPRRRDEEAPAAEPAPEPSLAGLQALQRTAGNAAVCRWLGAVRERYAAGLDTGDGPDDEAPEAPRAR